MRIEVELQSIGQRGFVARYTAGRGGRELRTATFEEMLEALREAHAALGAPIPRVELPPAVPIPQPPPRTPRHQRREADAAPPAHPVVAEAAPLAAMPVIPAPIGKRRAAEMRAAADEAADAALGPGAADRRRQMRARRL